MFKVNRNSDVFLHQNSDMSIGKRVREARKDAGLTQQQLAAKVGIKQSTLSELENGESAGTGYVASMAAALGVSPLWLETGKGPRKFSEVGHIHPHDASHLPENGIALTIELAELIALYGQSNPEWRKKVIDLARIGANQSGTDRDSE